VVVVVARAKNLDSIGIAYDFRRLKNAAKELIAPWDHQDLNRLPDFQERPPSAEQIAKLCYVRLSEKLNSENLKIYKVTVWENARCSASYFSE
jgi:6-pyruvoyltetrahydropterin/6-carboxytetrahydropterin synthase